VRHTRGERGAAERTWDSGFGIKEGESKKMGIVFIEGTVTGPTGKQAKLRFLVDSGATYTLAP
jgi:hypothetical protein